MIQLITVFSGGLKDGIVKIHFLRQLMGKVGHIALVYNGFTIKSHSCVGVDSRRMEKHGSMASRHRYMYSRNLLSEHQTASRAS